MTEGLTHGAGQDLLAAWKHAWEARDVDAFLALLTEDAEMRLDPFEPAVVGELAIRERWNAFAARSLNTELDAERLWVQGRTVLAAWHGAATDRVTAERSRLRGFLVFDLAADGRIARLRGWPSARVVGMDSTVKPEPEPVAASGRA